MLHFKHMLDQKQAGFATLGLILVILVIAIGAAAYFAVGNYQKSKPTLDVGLGSPDKPSREIKVAIGTHAITLDANTIAVLPTGATIDLTNFTFDPKETSRADTLETNTFIHSGTFVAYHKGYNYELSNYACKKGYVTHDDYMSNDRISCTLTISVGQTSPPALKSLAGTQLQISSQSSQIYDHTLKSANLPIANPGAPHYDIEVPYLQFWGEGDGKYWGVSGNRLRVKTSYGIAELEFDEATFDSDLQNHVIKSAAIGPVKVQVSMTNFSCFPPYLLATGQCSTLIPSSGPHIGKAVHTYNRVDYALNFTQSEPTPTDRLVLHY